MAKLQGVEVEHCRACGRDDCLEFCEGDPVRVECDCGASGPYAESIDDAAEDWNRMWVNLTLPWRSVEESLPVPSTEFTHAHVIATDGRQVKELRYGGVDPDSKFKRCREARWYDRHRLAWFTPTHWMPLPAPPR